MRAWARQHPLSLFVVLAYTSTWALLPLAHHYPLVGVLALLCPAVAAYLTAAACGNQELEKLKERLTHWRVHLRWYLVALLLPLPVSLLARFLEKTWGAQGPISPAPITWLGLIVFVMVVGEEIGWRGFALPTLLSRTGPVRASFAIGLIWAVWHLPLFFMDSMPQYGSPFGAYVVYTTALSIILTYFGARTAGSVLIATVFHGAVNTLIFVNAGATPYHRGWANAVAYGVAALFFVASGRLSSKHPGPHATHISD